MRCSVNVPNFGQFADPRAFGEIARSAEEAGWDGLFVWDLLAGDRGSRSGSAGTGRTSGPRDAQPAGTDRC
jgi:hypothetical protein